MNGVLVSSCLLGIGTLFGVFIAGGMRISNRQAAAGRYIRMPGGHRKVTHARPLTDDGGMTWRSPDPPARSRR